MIDIVPDLLLLSATLGLAWYCHRLARRLRTFDADDTTLGASIGQLSRKVDVAEAAFDATAAKGRELETRLERLMSSADDRIGRMEMLLSSCDDLDPDVEHAAADDPAAAEAVPGFRALRAGGGAS